MEKESLFKTLFREEKPFRIGIILFGLGLFIVFVSTVVLRGIVAPWKKMVNMGGIIVSFVGTEMISRYIAAISADVHGISLDRSKNKKEKKR
ncbi:MAG: hypothetical protein IJI56_04450 [Firmicutes bacterium]|nr:hypothetical protein [Bacillota bacterium]